MIRAIPAIPVQSVEIAVGFYGEKLGFEAFYHEGGFARLRRDDVELHLWEAGDESWKARPIDYSSRVVVSGAESFLAGTVSCRIEVSGVDQLHAEYKEKGVLYNERTVVEDQWWGEREFHTLDLHGNLLTFFERVT